LGGNGGRAGGGGGKDASDVGTVGKPFPDLGATGPPVPRVGHIYLSSISSQDLMAQLARVLDNVFPVLGSIQLYCKIYILSNIVRTL